MTAMTERIQGRVAISKALDVLHKHTSGLRTHTVTEPHTVRGLDRDTAGDCIGRAVLSRRSRYLKHLGVHAGVGAWAGTAGRQDVDCGWMITGKCLY
jgi:hypothetical protein